MSYFTLGKACNNKQQQQNNRLLKREVWLGTLDWCFDHFLNPTTLTLSDLNFLTHQHLNPLVIHCTLDRFRKTFFWNFQSIPADLCYILIYKPMLEKVFCSNVAPSLSSGNHLFYKAEYMGQSCPNQVWAITFDWSALAT